MSLTRRNFTSDFKKYDKSYDHFFYSSTDDYREDIKDDEVITSVRILMVQFLGEFYTR